MATNFPSSLDNFTNPVSGNTLDSPSHSLQHSDANDAIEAIEAKLGIGNSPAGSATSGYVLMAGTGGTTTWSAVPAADADVYFAARISTNQSIPNTTWTKVQFDTELFDSGTCYDPTTNYRFTVPSGKGGRYLLGVDVAFGVYSVGHQFQLAFYKNGSNLENNAILWRDSGSDVVGGTWSKLVNLNAGDYIEAYVYQNRGAAATLYSPNANFWGYKI